MENLTTGEAAAVLQVSRDTVRRLCERHELDCDRLSGERSRWRVYRESLERYAQDKQIRLDWKALER